MAKAWANKCQFKHNTCLKKPFECNEDYQFVGENIWLGSLKKFSPRDAITAWYNESEFYDFDSISCTKVCGHYIQVRISDLTSKSLLLCISVPRQDNIF